MTQIFNLIVSQNGDETPTILFGDKNNLFTITKEPETEGNFYLNSNGFFIAGKTFLHVQPSFGDDYPFDVVVDVVNHEPNQIFFKTIYNGIEKNGLLKNTPFLLIINE